MLKIRNLSVCLIAISFSLLSACAIEPAYRGPYVHPAYVSPGPEWSWRAHPYEGWGWYHPDHGWHRGWR